MEMSMEDENDNYTYFTSAFHAISAYLIDLDVHLL
jgi:hypothetical protein